MYYVCMLPVGVSLPVHAMDHMETARMIMHAAHALDNTTISWNPRTRLERMTTGLPAARSLGEGIACE